jgi:hypothetical protein
MSTCSFGMNHTFRDAFSVKMGQLVNQVIVLKENGSIGISCQRILIVWDWVTKLILK